MGFLYYINAEIEKIKFATTIAPPEKQLEMNRSMVSRAVVTFIHIAPMKSQKLCGDEYT